MKYCFLILAFIFSSYSLLTGVYDFTIMTPDGDEQSLDLYQGKKMMIVVLPVTHTTADSALLHSLDTLSRNYTDSITMIGIPSYEDGYADDSLQSLLTWYRSLAGDQFIIAAGMNTTKTSAYQSPLFSWLSHADQNNHFDEDVMGAGEKFFITETGDLYAIIHPDADWNEDLLKQMLAY